MSNLLLKDFAKAVNNSSEENTNTSQNIVYGTAVVKNGKKYVQIDGSDILTPVDSTTDILDGDRVTVTIKDHSAIATGNISSPAARLETVKELDNTITKFETVMSHKIVAEELDAINATFESLKAKVANYETLEALYADIDKLQTEYAEMEYVSAVDMEIINAEIDRLEVEIANATELSTDELEAINADITNLKSYNAEFTYVSAYSLEVVKADIKTLNTDKLSVKDADVKYANIDFSNISKATMKWFYAQSGLIDNVVIGDGTITGNLVGVTIKGDLIEGNTIKADKLVLKGEDGVYYKLNIEGGATTSEKVTKEDLQNGLSGSIIVANSITAEKIAVDDLVAFDATIGGFNITNNSLYSGVKSSVNNTTRGMYMDNTGQIAFGDSNSYIKYYKQSDGSYALDIAAKTIRFGSSGKTVEQAVTDVQNDVDTLRDEITTLLRIESSRGNVFKNDSVATVLSVVIYHGTKRITDSAAMHESFGSSAYLQWKWQRLDDDSFGDIVSTDTRIGDNGFTFTLSPEDVDTKVTFMCELIV